MDASISNIEYLEGQLTVEKFIRTEKAYPASGPKFIESLFKRLTDDQNERFSKASDRRKRMNMKIYDITSSDEIYIEDMIKQEIKNEKDITIKYQELMTIIKNLYQRYDEKKLFEIIKINFQNETYGNKLCCLLLIHNSKKNKDQSNIQLEFNNKIREFYFNLLKFLDANDEIEAVYEHLYTIVNEFKYDEIVQALTIINDITLNYHRKENFWNKIEKITNEICHTIKSDELFIIFKNNKRLLFYLIQNDFLNNIDYDDFLNPQIQLFINENQNKEIIDENDDNICQIIREDDVTKFKAYITKNNIQFDAKIKYSIFETNEMLMNNTPTLIEYAAFFGSINIFNFLRQYVTLNEFIWEYAIHGNNSTMINELEELKINMNIKQCLKTAIMCHHSDIYKYINNKYNNKLTTKINVDKYFLIYNNYFVCPNILSINIYEFFIIACNCNNFEIMENVMKSKQSINNNDDTMLFNIALSFYNKNAIKYFLTLIDPEILGLSINEELYEMQQQNAELKAELEKMQEQKIKIRTEEGEEIFVSLDKAIYHEIGVVVTELDEKEADLQAVKERISEIQTELETAEAEKKLISETNSALEKRITEMRTELKTLTYEQFNKNMECNELNDKFKKLNTECEDIVNERYQLQKSINETEKNIKNLSNMLKKISTIDEHETVYFTCDNVLFKHGKGWFYRKFYEDFDI